MLMETNLVNIQDFAAASALGKWLLLLCKRPDPMKQSLPKLVPLNLQSSRTAHGVNKIGPFVAS
jgi:hypothetical protein